MKVDKDGKVYSAGDVDYQFREDLLRPLPALLLRRLLLLAFGVLLVTNFVAQFGVLLCCVGLIPATLWSQIAFHHGLGQVARLGAAPKA